MISSATDNEPNKKTKTCLGLTPQECRGFLKLRTDCPADCRSHEKVQFQDFQESDQQVCKYLPVRWREEREIVDVSGPDLCLVY